MTISPRLLTAAVATVLCAFVTGGGALAEKLVISSSTHADLRLVSAPDPAATPVKIPANLEFPASKQEKYPVVVVAHTIGGWYEPNEGWFAAELRKSGFATLTYDSFTPRKFGDVSHGNDPRTNPSVIADGFAALNLLAEHPQVDRDRIAVIGFSLGGEVAHVTAFERARTVLASANKFAAHVVFYPAWIYGAPAGPGAYTGAPVLLLFAEKDELTQPEKVKPYLEYHEQGGSKAPLEVVTYPGAYHSWTNPRMPKPRFFPKHGSARKCPIVLIGGGPPRLLIDRAERPFNGPMMGKCRAASVGYTQGFNAQFRAKSLADTVAFLRKHMGQ